MCQQPHASRQLRHRREARSQTPKARALRQHRREARTQTPEARALRQQQRQQRHRLRQRLDPRAQTPQANRIREERHVRAFYCSGATKRHSWAHWLNCLIAERRHQPGTAYPFAKWLGRTAIRSAQLARQEMLASPTPFPPALS